MGEIGTVIDSQARDLLTVNQWVAGSSPAGGANIYEAYKDVGQSRVAPFGKTFGNNMRKTYVRDLQQIPATR